MCEGFGLIVSKELKAYFCEPSNGGDCSHSFIIQRLGWKENEHSQLRKFVRVEYPDWTAESFRFDEEATLPGWVEENRYEIEQICNSILLKITPAWAEYEKVRDEARAEYEKVRDEARAEYEKVRDPARAEFIKVISTIEGYVGLREEI